MNDDEHQNDPQGTPGDSGGGSPRPTIEPPSDNAPPPPPPPPPPGYGYPPPGAPAQQSRGMIGNLSKLGAMLSFGLVIFLAGFYLALFSFTARVGPTAVTYRSGEGAGRVAIIPIEGVIASPKVGFVRKVVNRIIDDESIKAVVLRVDSPGGGVTASDQILYELKRLKDEKGASFPIVGSYGSVAASGGYYVSCLADPIYMEPTTITGSIGVIGQVFTFEELLEEKLGIDTVVITSTNSPEKDTANNMFRKWNEKDKQVTQDMLDVMYEQFVTVIHENRGRVFQTRDDVKTIADGSIYLSDTAVDKGLVDEIGYLEAAIAKAEDLGGLSPGKAPVIRYEQPASFPGLLSLRGPGGADGGGAPRQIDATTVRRWIAELGVPELMYMMHTAH